MNKPIGRYPWPERFWMRVDKNGPNGCWIWVPSKRGYGIVRDPSTGKNVGVHRMARMLLGYDCPRHLVCDHLCRNPRCVNPDHIEMVTSKENCLRGVSVFAKNAAKAVCKYGHPFDEENTCHRRTNLGRNKNGVGRVCRICRKESSKRSFEKNKDARTKKHNERARMRFAFLRNRGHSSLDISSGSWKERESEYIIKRFYEIGKDK